MNNFSAVQRALLVLLTLIALPRAATAQGPCQGEPLEIPWVVPPAIAAIDGDNETFEPGLVFIGDAGATLEIWELSAGTLSGLTTLEPGSGLPANVTRIWDISVLSDTELLALVTYTGSGGEWYGFLRSSDQGDTWTLNAPATLQTQHFASVEGKKAGGSDWTGNFFRVPLYQMEWLADGLHGWAWGRQGIVGTTDGGATWSIVYETDAVAPLGAPDGSYQPVWGLAMTSPDDGVAVIGGTLGATRRRTTDGGESWTTTVSLAVSRLADLDAVGGVYRSVTFNGQHLQDNTEFYSSSDGTTWDNPKGLYRAVSSESVYPTDIVWTSSDEGFFVQRQGEIWHTTDAGVSWELEQEVDPQYDTVTYATGLDPGKPRAGYGQRTVAVRDDFGYSYLINVITDNCRGSIRPYIAVWEVSEFSSVPTEPRSSALELTVRPNPTSDRCELNFNLDAPSDLSVRIVDAKGEVLRQIELGQHAAGPHGLEIDLTGLPTGAYHLVIKSEQGESTRSVIVGTSR